MKPRLLLVEDDPISCSFMDAALQGVPAQVDTAGSMATALGQQGSHALWLLDVNLPDGSGIELLQLLRSRWPGTPAFAHTADDSPQLRTQLLAAGFDEVLIKPFNASRLQEAVRQRLGLACPPGTRVAESGGALGELPLWDPATALAALNGMREHVTTLRNLFLQELDRQHRDIVAALQAGDQELASSTLHQLRASSGFVGATRLNAATRALESSPGDADALAWFSASVTDTRSAAAGLD